MTLRAHAFSAFEFRRAFTVRRMTAADKEWYEKVMKNQPAAAPRAGRPVYRYYFESPHPLQTTHIIVRHAAACSFACRPTWTRFLDQQGSLCPRPFRSRLATSPLRPPWRERGAAMGAATLAAQNNRLEARGQ